MTHDIVTGPASFKTGFEMFEQAEICSLRLRRFLLERWREGGREYRLTATVSPNESREDQNTYLWTGFLKNGRYKPGGS
ncbi:hypothetical protein CEXT_141931 [Caerostris extrusa]|uniref:Uncharacterized protein n=1 Tax=Caerostris extrusa TaxID=172846 RepID=A0AAV4QR91_CAEEX|nr:hypothetical protein CEXT_141931 [Caerostris extrusa]